MVRMGCTTGRVNMVPLRSSVISPLYCGYARLEIKMHHYIRGISGHRLYTRLVHSHLLTYLTYLLYLLVYVRTYVRTCLLTLPAYLLTCLLTHFLTHVLTHLPTYSTYLLTYLRRPRAQPRAWCVRAGAGRLRT